MLIDLVMGLTALAVGVWLGVCSGPLADHLQEGDDRYRENHPWVEAFEPQTGYFATADGRWWILRGWLLASALGFVVVGAALLLRATIV
jgi:hypothetical protein